MNRAAEDISMVEGAVRLDKRLVGLSFGRAAQGYDAVAHLQRRVGDALLAGLPALDAAPSRLLDVGAGTGYCSRRLRARFPSGSLAALDLAEGMLQRCRAGSGDEQAFSLICGDAENLPLRSGAMDLVFSNLALQWCREPSAVLVEFRRVLRPGGQLAFSTFGPATLGELREAWKRVDGYSHVLEFRGARELAAALAMAGFREVAVQHRTRVLTYASVEDLMLELKGLGASNRSPDRPRHLMGKHAMAAMVAAYSARAVEGRVPASFEVIHAYARRV